MAVMIASCAKENQVYVECGGSPAGFNCTVTHREGSDHVNACWQVYVECANGAKVTADSCQAVDPGQSTSKVIPLDKIIGLDKCDAAASTAVRNIVLKI